MPWEKQKNTPKKNCANFFLEYNHQKVLGTDPAGPLCSHANANYLEEPMHSIVTWKRLIPSRFPGRMLSRIFDGKHNEKGKLIVRHSEAVVTCVCMISFLCYLWRKKLRQDIVFLSLRTLLNCCYSSSCLGFYLRLFVCIFLGGKNHWSFSAFSAVVGRIANSEPRSRLKR